ncbi:hypothetical protein BaRGS_00022884, partial [Batillaria attramentaria]
QYRSKVLVTGYRQDATAALQEIKGLRMPDKYKLMASVLKNEGLKDQEDVEEELSDAMRDISAAEDQSSLQDLCTLTVPRQHLKNVDRSKLAELLQDKCQGVLQDHSKENGDLVVKAEFERFFEATTVIWNAIQMLSGKEEYGTNAHQPEPIKPQTFEIALDELQYEALEYLLGDTFKQAVTANKTGNGQVIVKSQKSALDEERLNSLRREDLQLPADDLSRLGSSLDAKDEGLEAFVKPLPDQGKVAIFAFDYNTITKAKHLVSVKAGKVKVTSRARRRFDGGQGSGQTETSPPHSMETVSTQAVREFTTRAGMKVLVYKTDITKLPVDAIVNAANGGLNHGGGVAAAIARAAGPALEDEGDAYIRKNRTLKVTEVLPTTAGAMQCQKVLHAVGPRWFDYQDKTLCQQDLEQTVFNCLKTAHDLGFSSLALSSISSVKSFDQQYGVATTLRLIHFVDVSDTMVSIIQDTFTRGWISDGALPTAPVADAAYSRGSVASPSGGQNSATPAHRNPLPADDSLGAVGGVDPRGPVAFPSGMSAHGRHGNRDDKPLNSGSVQVKRPAATIVRSGGMQHEGQYQYQFHFLDLDLFFQQQKTTGFSTDAVVLWQYTGNVLNDDNSKQLLKNLRSSELKKKLTEGAVETLMTGDKLYILPVVSSRSPVSQDNIRDLVEQALNKVDLAKKKSVAVMGMSSRKRASEQAEKNVVEFITGVYLALKNYTQRELRSVTEVHILDTQWEVLKVMEDTVSTMLAIDRSNVDQNIKQKLQLASPNAPSSASVGYERSDVLVIDYNIPHGHQKSATTGRDDVVIWNDIHHKTQTYGGFEKFVLFTYVYKIRHGYPDPGYLTRLQQELAAKNVTEKDLTDTQKDFIQDPQKYYRYNDFSHCFP